MLWFTKNTHHCAVCIYKHILVYEGSNFSYYLICKVEKTWLIGTWQQLVKGVNGFNLLPYKNHLNGYQRRITINFWYQKGIRVDKGVKRENTLNLYNELEITRK